MHSRLWNFPVFTPNGPKVPNLRLWVSNQSINYDDNFVASLHAAYLEVTCSGLLPKLYDEWYGEDGALRPAYALPGKAPKVPKAKGEKPASKGGAKTEGVQTRASKANKDKDKDPGKASPSPKKGSPKASGDESS